MEIIIIFIVALLITNYISFRWGFGVGVEYTTNQIGLFLNLALPGVLKDTNTTPDEFRAKMEVERIKLTQGLKSNG